MNIKYKIALKYYDRNEYEKAYALFMESAKEGDSDSQVAIAIVLYNGDNIEEDIKKSFFWFEKAIEQNNVLAMCIYGFRCLEEGDFEKGNSLIKKATELNYPVAVVTSARLYHHGEYNYEVDYNKAIEYYKEACTLGSYGAFPNLVKLCKIVHHNREDSNPCIWKSNSLFKVFKYSFKRVWVDRYRLFSSPRISPLNLPLLYSTENYFLNKK